MLEFHEVVRKVPVAEDVVRYAVRLAAASRPGPERAELRDRLGELGRRPPGRASRWSWGRRPAPCSRGRFHVSPDDIRALAHPTLRHRVLLGYRAEADGVTVDSVIDRLLEHVKGPSQS